jgi:hypothetical protein
MGSTGPQGAMGPQGPQGFTGATGSVSGLRTTRIEFLNSGDSFFGGCPGSFAASDVTVVTSVSVISNRVFANTKTLDGCSVTVYTP